MSIYDHNRPWNNSIKERVKNSDKDQIIEYFHQLCDKWTFSSDIINDACNNFNITDINVIDMGILQMELDKAMYETGAVYRKFRILYNEDEFEEHKSEWDSLYEKIFYGERLIRDVYLLNRAKDKDNNSLSNEDPDVLFKYSRYTDDSKKSPYQCLLLYLSTLR